MYNHRVLGELEKVGYGLEQDRGAGSDRDELACSHMLEDREERIRIVSYGNDLFTSE